MRIIVEAGGTKCKWGLIDDVHKIIETKGFNPNCANIYNLIDMANHVAGRCDGTVEYINYYGAGCGSRINAENIGNALSRVFNSAKIHVGTDLEAAAKALFGDQSGIAAIIGTGAAAGVYNGWQIVKQAPSVGYLLGDEGSGSFLGKTLITKILRNELSPDICSLFYSYYDTSADNIINKIYSATPINSYLADFVPFISQNIDNAELHNMVADSFALFYQKHIAVLNTDDEPLGIVGGVAFQFQDILKSVFSSCGADTPIIIKDAFSRLIKM